MLTLSLLHLGLTTASDEESSIKEFMKQLISEVKVML